MGGLAFFFPPLSGVWVLVLLCIPTHSLTHSFTHSLIHSRIPPSHLLLTSHHITSHHITLHYIKSLSSHHIVSTTLRFVPTTLRCVGSRFPLRPNSPPHLTSPHLASPRVAFELLWVSIIARSHALHACAIPWVLCEFPNHFCSSINKWFPGKQTVVPVGHSSHLVNTFDPDWWVYCFTDLFFRGDFRVPKGVGLRRWGRFLVNRMDFRGWAFCKEWAATVHNIHVRREQMWSVHKYLITSKQSERIQDALRSVVPGDFVRSALAAGDCENIRQA